jgi:hypothetical protein
VKEITVFSKGTSVEGCSFMQSSFIFVYRQYNTSTDHNLLSHLPCY